MILVLCFFMPMLRCKLNVVWLKKIKTFLMLKSKLKKNTTFFLKNSLLLSYYSYFNTFIIKKNESIALKLQHSAVYKKLGFIGINSNKIFFKKKNTFRFVYTIYKIFSKNGFLLKIVKSLGKVFKQLNLNFYNKCFFNYVNDNFMFVSKSGDESVSNTVELYSFKNFFYYFEDLVLINDNAADNGGIVSFNDKHLFANDDSDCDSTDDRLDNFSDTDSSRSDFFLNIFFKYFFFLNVSCVNNVTKAFQIDSLQNSYFYDIYNKNYKSVSVSFFSKYFFFLFYNIGKKVRLEYSKILNNFLSIFFFIPKLLRLITFFFKVQAVSLSKRVRKSLKNKYRHAIVYKYIKPNRRLRASVSFLKNFLLLVDGQGLDKKILNIFLSIVSEKDKSLIVQLKNIQQFECFKHTRFEKN